MYTTKQQKPQQSRVIRNLPTSSIFSNKKINCPHEVSQLKLIINGRDFNLQKLKKSYYRKILNNEADNNKTEKSGCLRHKLRYMIRQCIESDKQFTYPTFRHAIISIMDKTTIQIPTTFKSKVDDEFIINVGDVLTVNIHGKQCVRAYLSVFKSSTDGQFKDVTQNKFGRVKAFAKPNDIFWLNIGRPLRAVKWMEKYKRDAESSPLIRSFLIPYDLFLKIAANSVPEHERRDHKDHSFNVDVHYAPNQFGLTQKDLDELNKNIIPFSLITYYDNEESYNESQGGQMLPVSILKEQLGIPLKDDIFEIFSMKGSKEFTKHKKFATKANNLMWYYGMLSILDYDKKEMDIVKKTSYKAGQQISDMIAIAYGHVQKIINYIHYIPDDKKKIPKSDWENILKNYDLTPAKLREIALWANHSKISELIVQDADNLFKKDVSTE